VCVCVCGCIGVPLAGRVVVTLLDGVDRPGENHFGVVCYDEELLASEAVHHVGQVLAVVVATSRRYVG
jgi:xanthine dehydrogenase molybdopterin-binding subunit B